MPKVTLNDIASGYSLKEAYNTNNDTIEAAFDNTLSRDGSTPNQMEADIDLNSNSLLNVNEINGILWEDVLGQEGSFSTFTAQRFSGDGSTTAFVLSFEPQNKTNTQIYIDGVYQSKATYSLLGSTITFSEAPPVGTDNIEVMSIATAPLGATTSNQVTYTSEGGSETTVETKLRALEVTDYTALAAINNPYTGMTAIVTNDGIGGTFIYDATQAATNNGGTIINGWVRQYSGPIDVKWFGAGNGAADDSAEIQSAINAASAAGGGTVYFPAGLYNLQASLSWPSNVHYKGDGKASLLRVNVASGTFRIFNQVSANVDNVVFDGLGFDGSISYPANSNVYKQTLADATTAIRVADFTATNVTIKNCHFSQFSHGSIDINGFSSAHITIRNNYFYKGSYIWKVISLRVPSSSYTDAQRVSGVIITDNHLEINGPQYHYDPSKEDWCGSADAIQIDSGKDCIVSGNVINLSGGMGIRIEESLRVTVANNKITESGQEGISFYKDTLDCSCIGNTILNWGRIPNAYGIRNYSGTYVVAREFPRSTGPTLPVDPTSSTWFDVWPYSVDSIDTSAIIAYSASDYYIAQNTGILPFRGYSAISVTNNSQKISIVGNNILGSLSLDVSSKNTYASDFGITPIHSVNDAVDNSGLNCMVSNNGIVDTRVYRLYHPEYHDPINSRGLLGTAVYLGNRDTSSLVFSGNTRLSQGGQLIAGTRSDFLANTVSFPATQVPSSDPNTLDDYVEGWYTASITSSVSGSVTVSNNRLNYTKVGRMVTVTGELTVSAVSSPEGSILVNLPFQNAQSSNRSARTNVFINAINLDGVPTGFCLGAIESLATDLELVIVNDFVLAPISSHLQAGTAFRFGFSYLAAA